jgi:uncharacterized membrane protein
VVYPEQINRKERPMICGNCGKEICGKCGKVIEAGAAFCPSCGKPTGNGPGASSVAAETEENKPMCIVAYILFFVPLLTGAYKTSEAVKFHTNQGTVLFLAALVASIGLGIVFSVITGIVVAAGGYRSILTISSVFGIIWLVYGLGVTALCVIGIINAVNGRQNPLPLIGQFRIIR